MATPVSSDAPPILASIVAGTRREGGELMPDLNPGRPEDRVADVSLADAALAVEAVDAARFAAQEWRDLPAPARGEILRRAGDALESRADEIGRDLAREEGKTLAEGRGETLRAAAIMRYFAAQTLDPDGETYPSHSAQTFLYARREALGVVVAITPWNFPIAIPAWKLAPALAFGNAVIWKPAELVPYTSWHLVRTLEEAGLPPGVLNVVLGRGSVVGEALVTHPHVDAITFTGSNEVGRRLQQQATKAGKKVQLELGGKNPAVVLADADLELAAEQIARGAFLSAGQKCTATSRVIVEGAVFDEVVERLEALARSWTLGDQLDPDTIVGPLASEAQLITVLGYLDEARNDGGVFAAGGRRADGLGTGYFVEPTVVTGLGPASRVVGEEIFGPVAVVQRAASFDEALALANDTHFGLTAGIFTNDLDRALRFAQRVRAGVVKVNQETAGLEYHVPFGGMGDSSSGSREQGKVARDFFTQWKTVYLDAPRRS